MLASVAALQDHLFTASLARPFADNRLVNWHPVVLVTTVGKESQRNHPMVLILNAGRLDVDTVQISLRLGWRRVFPGYADVIGNVGVLPQNERRKIHGVEPGESKVGNRLAVGNAGNPSGEGRVVYSAGRTNLLLLHFGGFLHAPGYPPISMGLHDLEVVARLLVEKDARQIPDRHDEEVWVFLWGKRPDFAGTISLDDRSLQLGRPLLWPA